MTNRLVTAQLRSGEPLVFEVEEPEDFGVRAISIHVNPDTGLIDLDGALHGVREAAMQVLDTVRSIAAPPDSCEISFGLKLSGSLGAIIAKASTEANFTIKMVWDAKKDR